MRKLARRLRGRVFDVLLASVSAFCLFNVYRGATLSERVTVAVGFLDQPVIIAAKLITPIANNSWIRRRTSTNSAARLDRQQHSSSYDYLRTERIARQVLAEEIIVSYVNLTPASYGMDKTILQSSRYHAADTRNVETTKKKSSKVDPAGRLETVNRFDRKSSANDNEFPPYNVTAADGKVRAVPLWQRKLQKRKKTKDGVTGSDYILTELLQVRIYATDKAKWTMAELKQWLHYMFLAGVEHVYVCDHFSDPAERLDRNPGFRRYMDAGLVTYQPWDAVRNAIDAQVNCYQYHINRYKGRHRWQIAVDMDEYPFSPNDTSENFLIHFLDRMTDNVAEIEMPNYLMIGQGDRLRSRTTIERIVRMTPQPSNGLVKPIYRPYRIAGAGVHRNQLMSGNRLLPQPDELRMLHYWGAREQNWGPDTTETMARTVQMTSMRDAWNERLVNSLIVFGELDAFSNETGP